MIEEIRKELKKNSSKATVESIRKFVPGAQEVYGVKMPVINSLAKTYEGGGFPLVEQLWDEGSFEERMLAPRILSRIAKKDPKKSFKLVEHFSKTISDWAICDCIGMHALRKLRKSHQEDIFRLSEKLIASKNPWKRRLALVLVESYTKQESLHPRIKKLISVVKDDDEYYVKKAIVWLERNFKKKR